MPRLLDVRVGWYLARRQIKRASFWTTGLIVFVMVLTFLDLVLVTGLLVGIVAGITNLYRTQETGDVLVSTLDSKNYIDHSQEIISFINTLPQVKNVTTRYVAAGTIEANYLTAVDPNTKPDKTGAQIVGIDPVAENQFSDLSSYVKEGSYLAPGDYDEVLLGSELIDRYSFGQLPGLTPLSNVYPGTQIELTVNGQTRVVTVKGIVVTTANSPLAEDVFMPAGELSQLMGRTDFNVNDIAINLKSGQDPVAFEQLLDASGVSQYAQVQTFEQAIPNGVSEITDTFAEIGNAVASIGLVVASITIFIVIFINAVTRRKYIGIMKGIGISAEAIEVSYIIQSFFYALIGSSIGLVILYGFLVPYVGAHPIVLPISNAIIVAPLSDTLLRIVLLVAATIVAGFIPARMIVRKNTLDSILGRE